MWSPNDQKPGAQHTSTATIAPARQYVTDSSRRLLKNRQLGAWSQAECAPGGDTGSSPAIRESRIV
jgi:hypothetical protein